MPSRELKGKLRQEAEDPYRVCMCVCVCVWAYMCLLVHIRFVSVHACCKCVRIVPYGLCDYTLLFVCLTCNQGTDCNSLSLRTPLVKNLGR